MQVTVLGKQAPLALLGIQKGDVLRSLNGQSLASADGLLAALPIMRQQDQLTFSVLRANLPLNISVQVE